MLYRISVAEHGLTGIANIFRSRLSGLDDLLRAGSVPLIDRSFKTTPVAVIPVKPYFLSKSAEHDVTLTSFVAKL